MIYIYMIINIGYLYHSLAKNLLKVELIHTTMQGYTCFRHAELDSPIFDNTLL